VKPKWKIAVSAVAVGIAWTLGGMKRKWKIVLSVSGVGLIVLLQLASKLLDVSDNLNKTGDRLEKLKAWGNEHWGNPETWRYVVVALSVLTIISTSFAVFYRQRYHKLKSRWDVAKERSKQIVLFVPPNLGGFYGEYLQALVTAARQHGGAAGGEITILPHFTGEADFCPEQDLKKIVKLYAEHASVVKGVFVIPKDPSRNKSALTTRPTDGLPIVTLDVYPDAEEDPSYPHFVGGDEKMGGRCAARAAIELFERKEAQSKEFRILILIGSTTPWESQRVVCFKEQLEDWAKREKAKLDFVMSKPLNYEYNESVDYLENWRTRESNNGVALMNPLDADLIFACSDTMALGAAKAVRHLTRQQLGNENSRVKIIGYDGTVVMKRALEAGSDVLWATVDVRLDEQASRAVEVMMKLMRDGQCERRMTLVSPRVLSPRVLRP